MAPPAQTGTQAIDRAAELLVRVVERPAGVTFTDLAAASGLARSTTSRILQALERHGLVQRDRSGAFHAGPVFALYASRHDAGEDLVATAQPVLERLGELTGETINLAVPQGDKVLQVAQVDSRYLLGATNWVGLPVPLHCSALGKVFLAYGATVLPGGRLERRTPHTITNREALAVDLQAVTRRGWAVAVEELEPGLVAIAAPVRAGTGTVVAALSVSGPTARITPDRIESIGALLAAEGRGLSARLGHHSRKEGAA